MPLVIMFHSVGLRLHPWCSPQIAEDIEPFRGKLLALRRAGYEVVKFTDPRLWQRSGADRYACLTFDDGYLDNWVHVFPVLRDLDMPATIFVSPEFVDPGSSPRPQLGDTDLRDADHDPFRCCAGYLNWAEMRAMEESGLVEIESHALTHTRAFVSPNIIDFWAPGAATRPGGPAFLLWNEFPEEKPEYLMRASRLESRIPYGTPVYEHRQALIARRFLPDDASLREGLTEYLRTRGEEEFFERPDAMARLEAHVRELAPGGVPGRHESPEEQAERIRGELAESKERIEEALGKRVTAICWPEGGVTREVVEIARECGYERSTLPSAWVDSAAAGEFPEMMPRIGSVPREIRGPRDLGNLSSREFEFYLRRKAGSGLHRWLHRGTKTARYLRSLLRPFGERRPHSPA